MCYFVTTQVLQSTMIAYLTLFSEAEKKVDASIMPHIEITYIKKATSQQLDQISNVTLIKTFIIKLRRKTLSSAEEVYKHTLIHIFLKC